MKSSLRHLLHAYKFFAFASWAIVSDLNLPSLKLKMRYAAQN